MALVTKEFKLDLAPGKLRPVVNASQGDIGRPFMARCYWDGSPWTATGYTANIRGRKPDGTVFDYTATVDGSTVTFETTEQMTIISGPVECELVFSNDGDVIASANFVLMVEDSPYNPDAPSESVIPGIVDLIEDTIGWDVRDEVQAELEAHPEWTTTVQDGAITKEKLNENLEVIQYNILDYEGATLNEKWDAMRQDFHSWEHKQVLIPYPREGNNACIKVGNNWEWKLDAPIVLDNSCNCSTIYTFGEWYPTTSLQRALYIHDTVKPDNIVFGSSLSIRGDRQNGKTIDTAIEISCGARIKFNSNVYINDCGVGVIVGGSQQTRPAECGFSDLYISFFDDAAVQINGGQYVSAFTADNLYLQCAQETGKNAVDISEHTTFVDIGSVQYNTDVPKDGYDAEDVTAVVRLHADDYVMRNVNIGFIYGNTGTYGLLVDNTTPSKIFDVNINSVGTSSQSNTGVYARHCNQLNIGEVSNNNKVDILNCYYSKVGKCAGEIVNADRYCNINSVGIDKSTSFLNVPPTTGLAVGDVTMVNNANGTKVYLFNGTENIPFDGQMFVPVVATLPTADWKTRGKMYRVNNDSGEDVIAVCIRYGGNSYKWFNIISGSVI